MKKMVLLGAAALALLLAVVIGRVIFSSKSKTTEASQKETAPAVKTQPPAEKVENKTAPVQGNTAPAASIPAGAPQPVREKINLLDKKNGGKIMIASKESWVIPIDENIIGAAFMNPSDFAVFAFKDEKPATFDMFTLYIPGTSDGNPKEFELFISNDSPESAFASIGKFQTKNYLMAQTPFQEFKFSPVKARYLKVVFYENYGGGKESTVRRFKLMGVTE